MELLRLRMKDLDLERRQIVVRDGKGFKDRSTTQIYTHVMQKPGLGVCSPLDG